MIPALKGEKRALHYLPYLLLCKKIIIKFPTHYLVLKCVHIWLVPDLKLPSNFTKISN